MVREVVAPVVEQAIAGSGFRFEPGSLTFKRRIDGTQQTIHLGADVQPRYAPGALVVLGPTINVEYEATAPFLDHEGVRGSGGSISQPVAYGGATKQWEIGSASDAPRVAGDLARDVADRILPLLEDLRTPEALTRAYGILDSRVMWHDQVFAAVIAAHAVMGDREGAREIARHRLRGKTLGWTFPKVARLLET